MEAIRAYWFSFSFNLVQLAYAQIQILREF